MNQNSAEKSITAKEYRQKKLEITPKPQNLWGFPELTREERKNVVSILEAGANWNFAFGLLTALSTSIASLGLIQGSPATVIGAMVVAPLMLPLIAGGLSLAQGNILLFKNSLKTMGLGILLALAASFLIGLIIPRSDLSAELIARMAPNLLDLAVAFLAGFAAAFAVARPELLGALAGVAISVALVPPLATTGIALADAVIPIAYGSAVLFLTNMVAIILGSAAVFRCFGIVRTVGDESPSWPKQAVLSLILGTAMLSGLLGYEMIQQYSLGQSRPLSYPLTQRTVDSIEKYLTNNRGIHYVLGGRKISQDGANTIFLFLSASRAVEQDFTSLMKKHIQEYLGSNIDVQIHIFQEVKGTEATTYIANAKGIVEKK